MKFTLSGFERFLNGNDSSLFEDAILPEGADIDIIKGVIFERYGEMETLYADPYKMRFSTNLFFKKHAKTFEKWFMAVNLDYEPLYNFDRYEEWTDEGSGSKNANTSLNNASIENSNTSGANDNSATSTKNASENSNEAVSHNATNASSSAMNINEDTTEANNSNKISNGNSQRNTASDDTNKVSAYNSVTLPDAEKEVTEGYEASANSAIENSTINGTSNRSGNNSNTSNSSDASEDTRNSANSSAEIESASGSNTSSNAVSSVKNDNGTSNASESSATLGTHRGHLYGNIGVTTSSALLLEFLDASAWSFYDHVADLYAEELLLMIY